MEPILAKACVTCGKGFAVTTEGECGICDAKWVQPAPVPPPVDRRVSTG